MSYYNQCPDCGANLDPGEKCECQTNAKPMYISIKDLATRWACSADYVYALVRQGALPAMRLGRAWRIGLAKVEAYEAEQMMQPRTASRREPVLRL